MEDHSCANCAFRAKYDNNSRSFLGRLWKWHTRWCPGWKAYLEALPKEERDKLKDMYQ